MADFDARLMLDCYLYDYFMKKNLPELAETFLKEANLKIDPNVALAIDVPEGFLLEWWKGSCDYASFRDWLNQQSQEKPSMEATQEHNHSRTEMNKQSLVDYASAIMSNGRMSPALQKKGKAPLAFSPSSNEEGLPTPELGKATPTIYASTITKGSIKQGDDSTYEAIMTDDDASGTSDCTSKMGKLSTASEVPTVHQLDSYDDN